MTLREAAHAYVNAGWYLVPTSPTDAKNPGSVVGGKWHTKSSRDPKKVDQWWSQNPDYGIALHVGRSGAVVFDLDVDDLGCVPTSIAEALRTGAVQNSRTSGDRGHYVFACGEDEFSNSAGSFGPFGEVRGRNGVIIAEPTPHNAAGAGGRYSWQRVGEVPRLSTALRECLRATPSDLAEPLTSAELSGFLAKYARSVRPALLDVPVGMFKSTVAEGISRHDALVQVLPMAYRDAVGGAYTAQEATERLRAEFEAAFGRAAADEGEMKQRRSRPGGDEFQKVAEWAAAQAVASGEGAARARLARVLGSEDDEELVRTAFEPGGAWHPDNPQGNAYRHPGTIDGQPVGSTDNRQFTQSLAGVEPTKVQWLWWPWIPRGKLTMFEGEPDVGKSTMTLTWAATVSNGGSWPGSVVGDAMTSNEKGLHRPADVVLVGMEDDLADTVVPRLNAAGADLSRVSTMARPRDRDGRPIPFLIPEDVDKLKRAIEEVDAKLVVIDPISAFMSDSVKAGSDSSNRKALMELVDVAEQTGAAVVLVRHLNKATGMSAKHRGGGSIAFTALARSSLIAAKLAQTDDRENTHATHGLASIKGNLTREPKALGYRLISSPSDADSPIVQWQGVLDENADQLVGADGVAGDARKSAPARDEAERVIRELLAGGPMGADEVRKAVAKEVGCSEKTVSNAANKMSLIKTPRRGADGRVTHWLWALSGRLERGGPGPAGD